MKELPTLEGTIKKRAEEKLDRDIKEASENFKTFLAQQKGLFRTGINLCILDEEKKSYPYLGQLFSCEYVKNKIKANCLGEYIEREIKLILNDPSDDEV